MSEEWKSPSEEEEEAEDMEWTQIVHTACGLPIELCDCPEGEPQGGDPEGVT